jgi:hypothetical protein
MTTTVDLRAPVGAALGAGASAGREEGLEGGVLTNPEVYLRHGT